MDTMASAEVEMTNSLHASQLAPSVTYPSPLFPVKNHRICINLRKTSGKSGVDMYTPVHPVATPLSRDV